ncbi:acetolactate synthase large subunit [Granulosicoccus antarcticus]|uniref:Acetolactate synthase large subunit IlvX n=1 Tax=Granulosicoccus antarcticus IMCC3135 TaxID=1192854 RepID=A0A2Z2NUU5_9GAMM|nr:acetolactate synthase large subunit [Granulosicoccus antarcticus]ASJ70864.1 Putative acetolactate synthase large subunit IlvX [Granulosicoccus antarcticus IMCC3135]
MNGAESLVRSLLDADVDVCFANPGTSEMHFVAALDKVGGMRCVLGLFEGVVTGAADGYARMAEKPAVTLLHTGPGLANGIANLHNARKAGVPIVNMVGEHASWHIAHDAPLTSDIAGLAAPVSHWLRTCESAANLASDGADAVAAAGGLPGKIATLIVPANTAWESSTGKAQSDPSPTLTDDQGSTPEEIDPANLQRIAEVLNSGESVAIVIGGAALRSDALKSVARIAKARGASLFCETFKSRMERGAGRVPVDAIPYRLQSATTLLEDFEHIVAIGTKPPIAFFAYPDTRSELYSEKAEAHQLASLFQNVPKALDDLEAILDTTDVIAELQPLELPVRCEDGPLTPGSLANVIARLLPEDAIVVDESVTAGREIFAATQGSHTHDWLEVCGGSIGGGLPLATGAAIAAPDRPVFCFEGDGSAMYTVQSLWTQARESLNITTIILANQSYDILKYELENVQASSGEIALSMMDLTRPSLDWVAMSESMGVAARKVATVAELEEALKHAASTQGPFLIEARL